MQGIEYHYWETTCARQIRLFKRRLLLWRRQRRRKADAEAKRLAPKPVKRARKNARVIDAVVVPAAAPVIAEASA
jgi:hypothetical protein